MPPTDIQGHPAAVPGDLIPREEVEQALQARVPGGAQVRDWLPMQDDAKTSHSTAYTVMSAALAAGNQKHQRLIAEAESFRWLCQRFADTKSSASQRILDDLNLCGESAMPLEDCIAATRSSEK